MSNRKKPLKKQKIRNSEYYDMQAVFDELYADSAKGKHFTDLVEIIGRPENIKLAYRNMRKNSGSKTAGVDNKTISDLNKWKEPVLIAHVQRKLDWHIPNAVHRVEIPKDNGKTRPLGIPTIMDRLIQQCILQILESVCEAKFFKRSNGFRPNHSAENAIAKAERMIQNVGCHYVIDIDIKSFFDNVNHGKLLKQMWTLGIGDKKLLSIISAMLKAEVAGIGFPEKGTPQGGIISPLLSNIVLNELDWWIVSQWEEMPTKRNYVHSMLERNEYDQKAEKTNGGELVSSYMCSPETDAEEFEISKKIYAQITGRSQPKEHDVVMYRIIQSFKPGEISPEDANKIGYELSMKFTKGQHQFVVATHTDKKHIHTHIEFNSTNLDCDGKFENVWNSAFILRQLNDEICRAHGLSVIENPKESAKQQKEIAVAKYGTSFKERLRQTIDRVMPECRDYDDFLEKMRTEGYEIKEGKQLSFRAPGQERFTRSNRLGDEYTKEALRERCSNRRGRSMATAKKLLPRTDRKINLLIDIRAKLDAGKGAGYAHWAKIFNLKEAAKTLNFLIENDLTDYDEMAEQAAQSGSRFDEVSGEIKKLEARMAEVAQFKTHIIQYSKTREVYAAYKKSRHKKEFLAEHKEEIAQHEAAKKAFDALNGKPIQKVAQISKEYGMLLSAKQSRYAEYKALRQEMIDYRTMKQNVDKILRIEITEPEKQREQKPER